MPSHLRRIAIGDVHGCARTLKELLYTRVQLRHTDQLYFLGDYISKGPDVVGVLNTLLDLKQSGMALRCLMGNHEDMLMDELKQYGSMRGSFGFGHATHLFDRGTPYRTFMNGLEACVELDSAILVHGGIDFRKNKPFEPVQRLLWQRKTFYNKKKARGRRIIHGHTPETLSAIEQNINANSPVINLDGGCVYPEREGMGNLLALDIDSLQLFVQTNIDQQL